MSQMARMFTTMRQLPMRQCPGHIWRLMRAVRFIHFIVICGLLYAMERAFSITEKINYSKQHNVEPNFSFYDDLLMEKLQYNSSNWRKLSEDELNSLSVLGRRLYLGEDIGRPQNRNFTIHVWKSYKQGYNRFMKQYGPKELDPFRHCSVKNCHLTHQDSEVHKADAVLIHLWFTKGPSTFPIRTNFKQRWIWLSDECPPHTFSGTSNRDMRNYNGFFNWSMTYRMDSDVPVPYGRTVFMTDREAGLYQEADYFNRKSKLVAIMGSHCVGVNKRWDYVKELKKHVPVDMYGGCGNLICPGRMKKDCVVLNEYKFYLAFENRDCLDYFTEKLFFNAIFHGAVPVIMGGSVHEARRALPPGSFLHINEFQSPRQLAQYMIAVGKDRDRYMKHHAWRSRFLVTNEHGYTGSEIFHYCRICEALNYNDPAPKEYNHMEIWWNTTTQCYPHTWVDRMNKAEANRT